MDFLLIVPVLLFSVVVHEVAHAWQALREGDTTARDLGRITLNPIPHLDLMGSIIVPLVLHFLPGDFLFGWAKPVPVNPRNYRSYRAGDIRVSLAGIVANLCLAAVCAALLAFMSASGVAASSAGTWGTLGESIVLMVTYGVFINLILAYFNLIPVPPLDGSHVLCHLLPARFAARYRSVGRYGITVLFLTLLVFPGAFAAALSPVFLAFRWILSVTAG